MDEFSIGLEYKGVLRTFTGRLIVTGYTHRICFDIDGTSLVLEPDEERNYRAVVAPQDVDKLDGELVRSIAAEMQDLLR
ncbi:MAG TPA: hypothetical protein VF145_06255 [Chitinophagaceae bacterium]